MKRFFTIGMAGHIDHGKTTLTKALTNIDTDRLKEEKERQISIELGFAPLHIDDSMEVSVIDVPGHERFIRQMIAGVAGIDLVVLVVAADEGVMPQTKEHLEILSFLGIERGIVAISKIDRVDPEFTELVKEEVKEQLGETVFRDAPMVLVDSISHQGLEELKAVIKTELNKVEKQKSTGSFRLPIDQVFTVKGQGTVVRGTVYEGSVKENSTLTVLPEYIEVKARQLQVHHKQVNVATAGQRVAINLAGITKQEITRGDVLVSSTHYVVTQTIDVALSFVKDLEHIVKQRTLIKCHIGTSEVMGKIVFFDRNEVDNEQNEILCQLRLEEPIVTKRGDRFILRRPTPTETIGGGWVIDPDGQKYRFGQETITMLKKKQEGTPLDRVKEAFRTNSILTIQGLIKETGIPEATLAELLTDPTFVEVKKGCFTFSEKIDEIAQLIKEGISDYHEQYPLRSGLNKAEITQTFAGRYTKDMVDFVIDVLLKENELSKEEQYISRQNFTPTYPSKWVKRMEGLVDSLKEDNMHVKQWNEYLTKAGLPEKEGQELFHHLLSTQQIYKLDEKLYIHHESLTKAVTKLKAETTESFELKDAKDILDLSRKYIVPFLELLDSLHLTRRIDNKREWR